MHLNNEQYFKLVLEGMSNTIASIQSELPYLVNRIEELKRIIAEMTESKYEQN